MCLLAPGIWHNPMLKTAVNRRAVSSRVLNLDPFFGIKMCNPFLDGFLQSLLPSLALHSLFASNISLFY
jgi:hypothetical protein